MKECKPLGHPPLDLLYNDSDRKERGDRVTTLKGGTWRCVVNEIGQHAPLTWREPAKISKRLLADFAVTHFKQSYENLCFATEASHM
jgi:hypothetical protein